MKKLLGRVDLGYGVVLVICFLAIYPFFRYASLPAETDAELHIFRLAELARLIQGGEFYPRWAPNFYYGYGYPIFNYYAPLSYYIGLVPMLLWGATAVQGVKFVFVLGILSAGIGTYGFVRDNWGLPAAYVATAVYVYAPYIHYVDPHARGDLAEAVSFGLLPLGFWALDRLRRRPTAGAWLTSVLTIAGIVLIHNLMAMVFIGLLVAWLLWVSLFVAREEERSTRSGWLALFLGIGIAAFFWLPVALESNAVNLGTLVGEGDHFDFRNHFLSISTLLSMSTWLDWGATESEFVFNLGIAQWSLGGLGMVCWAWRGGRQRRMVAFFVVATAGLLFMMLPASSFLWELLPLLPFLQFPWRLLGATVFMLAILAGFGTATIIQGLTNQERRLTAYWVVGCGLLLAILPALPLIQLPPWSADFGATDAKRIMEIELEGRWLGTTSTADFVPATVDVLPTPQNSVLRGLRLGEPVDRINHAVVPANTTITPEYIRPLHTRYTVEGSHPFAFRLFLFAFPGWTVRVDDAIMDTEIGLPEGFLWFPLEAGTHVVDVSFENTVVRRNAGILSLLSLSTALALAFVFRPANQLRMNNEPLIANHYSLFTTHYPLSILVLFVVYSVTAFHILVVEPNGWLRYESRNLVAMPADTKVQKVLGDEIVLIGWDVPPRMEAGEAVELTLYWQVLHPLVENYQVFVHLLNEEGLPVAQSDKLNPGEFPTERWPEGKYVRDVHRLEVPANLPAGIYRLTTGLWLTPSRQRLLQTTGEDVVFIQQFEVR